MENGELNRLLGRLSRLHFRRSYTEFSKQGITQGQPRILRYLKAHEGCIQRELSENCHLEPATITSILEKMEQSGMVDRRNEPGSRRNMQVFLTARGQECLEQVERVDRLLEEECFCGFDPGEITLASGFIERICSNLIKREEEGQEA